LAIFLMAVSSAALPIVISGGVDVMAESRNEAIIPLLVAIVFITGVGVWALNWVRRRLTTEIIADVIMTMRTDAFDAAARQDLSFYDEFSSGRVVSRITTDTQEFGEVITLSTDVINQLSVALFLIVVSVYHPVAVDAAAAGNGSRLWSLLPWPFATSLAA
jgi:ATP-binding cassette, subfamily B, bacterial